MLRRFLFFPLIAWAFLALGQSGDVKPVKTFQPYTGSSGNAQQADTPGTDTAQALPGTITIHQDEKITRLMEDFTTRKHVIKGYRVQIYLGDRKEAEEVRRNFLIRHSDVSAYLSYLAPNFRVRAGDLRTRLEAEKLRQEVIGEFPGSYIVPDEIEMPRLQEPGEK